MATLFVSKDPDSILGFSKNVDYQIPILYIDTERNKHHQLPLMLKQILLDSKLTKEELKSKFTILPFSEISRGDRLEVMGAQYRDLKSSITESPNNTLIIILDIVSDFILDFNNLQLTYQLTDLLNSSTNGFNITYMVVLHENPGVSDKARGHLGTELANKASTVLQIAATEINEVYKISIKKSRMTEKYKPILLQFDKDANNLVVLSDSELADKIDDPDCFKLCEALSAKTFTQAKIERKDLFEYLIQELGWSERKIHAKVTFIINSKKEFDSEYGRVYLKKTRGTTTQFELELLELPDRAENQLSNEDTYNQPPVPA
ncbi:MAG: hypothetical protein IPN14_00185 [Bacteroidetes bacterium]|nr:hypothetical protein [Bacteroidota bacterium]